MKKSNILVVLEDNPAIRRKNILAFYGNKTSDAFDYICETLKNDPSCVIRHEASFILGSTKNKKAVKFLIDSITNDESDLVRHESIESLGDLGFKTKNILSLLKKLSFDENSIIRDTATIALKTLELQKD